MSDLRCNLQLKLYEASFEELNLKEIKFEFNISIFVIPRICLVKQIIVESTFKKVRKLF